MIKFKRNKHNRNIKYIFIIIVFLIMFSFVSFITLNKSYSKFINYLLDSYDSNETHINLITSDLDNIINTYCFKKK